MSNHEENEPKNEPAPINAEYDLTPMALPFPEGFDTAPIKELDKYYGEMLNRSRRALEMWTKRVEFWERLKNASTTLSLQATVQGFSK